MQDRLDAANRELQRLQEENADLHRQLHHCDQRIDGFHQEIAELKVDFIDLKQHDSDTVAEYNKLRAVFFDFNQLLCDPHHFKEYTRYYYQEDLRELPSPTHFLELRMCQRMFTGT